MEAFVVPGFWLSVLVVYGFCCYRIAQRLGYDGLLGILLLVPLINMVMMFMWALNESPNERKIVSLEHRLDLAQRRAVVDEQGEADPAVHALDMLMSLPTPAVDQPLPVPGDGRQI